MSAGGEPLAADLRDLHAGLPPEELTRVYRRLARRYHPDVSGTAPSKDAMARINAAYDAIRRAAPEPPKRPSAAPQPAPEPADAPPREPAEGKSREPAEGKSLVPDAALLRSMEDFALRALDDWLEVRQGLPRETARRRMAVTLGLRLPTACPTIHMPDEIRHGAAGLSLHYPAPLRSGANILVIPVCTLDAGQPVATGVLRAVLRDLTETEPDLPIPVTTAQRYGFAPDVLGGMPLRLLFLPEGSDRTSEILARGGGRFRGVFL